jgi:hypothetical protein
MTVRSALVLAALSLLFSCSKSPEKASPEAKVGAERLRLPEARLSTLERRMNEIDPGVPWVSTENEDISIVRTRFGSFPIASRGATPYLDGFKIKLAIGNITTAAFRGVKLTLLWGPSVDALKSQTYNLAIDLQPGTYTTTEITIAPARPEEIKEIGVATLDLRELYLGNR